MPRGFLSERETERGGRGEKERERKKGNPRLGSRGRERERERPRSEAKRQPRRWNVADCKLYATPVALYPRSNFLLS